MFYECYHTDSNDKIHPGNRTRGSKDRKRKERAQIGINMEGQNGGMKISSIWLLNIQFLFRLGKGDKAGKAAYLKEEDISSVKVGHELSHNLCKCH